MSDLVSSNDVATNGVNGRIGNKTRCKCECCAPMETSIEGVSCLEIPQICKRRFLSTSRLNVCRSDPHFSLWYPPHYLNPHYLISTQCWSLANQNKIFYHFSITKTFHFINQIFFFIRDVFLWAYFLKRAFHWIQGFVIIKRLYPIVRIARSSHSRVVKNVLNGGELYEIYFLGIWKNI